MLKFIERFKRRRAMFKRIKSDASKKYNVIEWEGSTMQAISDYYQIDRKEHPRVIDSLIGLDRFYIIYKKDYDSYEIKFQNYDDIVTMCVFGGSLHISLKSSSVTYHTEGFSLNVNNVDLWLQLIKNIVTYYLRNSHYTVNNIVVDKCIISNLSLSLYDDELGVYFKEEIGKHTAKEYIKRLNVKLAMSKEEVDKIV